MSRKNKKAKLKKIVDTSRQFTEPQRLPFHWMYLIYFGTALICSMWQHAHPILTITLLLLLFPIGALAYVPYKYFSSNLRFVGQLVCMLFAIAWCLLRLKAKIPIDKVLLEVLCTISFCFIIAQRQNDYDYLLLASIFLFLYGALLPRPIFIIAFLAGTVLCAMLLYSTRLKSISRQLDLKTPPHLFRRGWPQYLLHLILTFIIFYYVFSLLPNRENEGEGIFTTSFQTANELRLPPAFRKWFSRGRTKKSPDGDSEVRSGSPTNVGKSGIPIKMKSDQAMSSRGKGGGGSPGKELIFRVKSPVKLYWVAQIYDIYDGNEWTFSKKKIRDDVRRFTQLELKISHCNVTNKFIIEKWITPKLYFAYRPILFDTFSANDKIVSYLESAFNTVLSGKVYPALPFTYYVSTALYVPKPYRHKSTADGLDNFWIELFTPEHYLKLPQRKISKRLKQMVKRLTAGIKNPYRKALCLRNYLRKNYKYKLYPAPVPRGRETADYFLFDLREGHCEYFASSLAVMARLAGLPARVVTGFSPGNYNALNKYFEVHAYHAHAWTQIFIPGMGWLTMDGSPPGSIESRTTPFGIGSMRDPFGDSWRVTPPEITPETIAYIEEKHYEQLKADSGIRELSPYEEVLLTAMLMQDTAGMRLNNCLFKLDDYKERALSSLETIFKKVKTGFVDIFRFIDVKFRELSEFLRKHWFILIPIVVIFIAMFLEIVILKRYFKRKLGLYRSRVYYTAAHNNFPDNPGKSVRMCYYMTRSLLNLGGFPRPRNTELFDYGKSLKLIDIELYKNVLVIFFLFSKLEYSAALISEEEADETLERVEDVRRFIYPLIHETSELKKGFERNVVNNYD